MGVTIRRSAGRVLGSAPHLEYVAWVVWTAIVVALILRPLLLSHRGTSFDTYQVAGLHWLHGEEIYTQWMGFVYSPVVAAFFAPFAWMPTALANIFWRVLNSVLLLGGLAAVLKTSLFAGIKEKNFGVLLSSPGSAGDWKYRYQPSEPIGGRIAPVGDRRRLR